MGLTYFIAGALLVAAVFALVIQRGLHQRQLRAMAQQIDAFLMGRTASPSPVLSEGDMSVLLDAVVRLEDTVSTLKDARRLDSEENMRWLLDVSHQLKTPLASLRLFAEMDASPHQAEQLQLLSRLERLLLSLLRLEKLRAGGFSLTFEQTDLLEMVAEAQMPLVQLFPGIKFFVTGQAQARCDRVWMTEAIGNVLRNACEQSSPDGRVDIALMRTDTAVHLTITDHAGGVPPEALPRLFHRFFQGGKSQGVGVGLAITQEIISRHHGLASAENTADGLRVTLTLPILETTLTKK